MIRNRQDRRRDEICLRPGKPWQGVARRRSAWQGKARHGSPWRDMGVQTEGSAHRFSQNLARQGKAYGEARPVWSIRDAA